MKSTAYAALSLLASCAAASVDAPDAAPEPAPGSWDAVLGTRITDAWSAPENRAFDFWIGEWRANWRPREEGHLNHVKEGTWTHQWVFPILDGKALVELAERRGAEDGEPSGRGFSIRYYDPAREEWVMAQHWPNPNFGGIAFTDQLIGAEHHGRLSMYSVDTRPKPDGSRDHRRYNFSDIAPDRFRWDGSNTSDVGATWTTWQVVDFYRIGQQPALPAAGGPFPGVYNEQLCTEEPHRALDGLQGVWEGTAEIGGVETPARLTVGKLLDGCAVAGVLERPSDGFKRFVAWSYSPAFGAWIEFHLDDAPGAVHSYRLALAAGPDAVFTEAPDLAIKDDITPMVTRESFDTEAGAERTTWRALGDDAIEFDEETRSGDAWTTSVSYRLSRVGDP